MNRQLSEQDLTLVLSVFSKHLFWEKHAYLINKGSFKMELLTTLSLEKNIFWKLILKIQGYKWEKHPGGSEHIIYIPQT